MSDVGNFLVRTRVVVNTWEVNDGGDEKEKEG